MSLFEVIALSVGIAIMIVAVIGAILNYLCYIDSISCVGAILSFIAVAILSFCIIVGFNTMQEKAYLSKFVSQKQTIEASLQNDNLTGLEKLQIVNTATELNGDFAQRKTLIQSWLIPTFCVESYNSIELIKLNNN